MKMKLQKYGQRSFFTRQNRDRQTVNWMNLCHPFPGKLKVAEAVLTRLRLAALLVEMEVEVTVGWSSSSSSPSSSPLSSADRDSCS